MVAILAALRIYPFFILELEDNNSSFYVLAGLASAFLEELTTLPLIKYSYELNALQFDALKELVLEMLNSVGKTTLEDWNYFFQGK